MIKNPPCCFCLQKGFKGLDSTHIRDYIQLRILCGKDGIKHHYVNVLFGLYYIILKHVEISVWSRLPDSASNRRFVCSLFRTLTVVHTQSILTDLKDNFHLINNIFNLCGISFLLWQNFFCHRFEKGWWSKSSWIQHIIMIGKTRIA